MANLSSENWCTPWTKSVYLYGLVIPGIALFIFGLTFIPIALYYFATSRNFRRSAYSYYFSVIAVVDLVRLTIWFLFLVFDFQIFKLQFYLYECSIQVFSESVASSISAWLTVALTAERCLVIYRPLQTLTDPKGKRAIIVIFSVILASCAVNSLLLHPQFYKERIYKEDIRVIICYYVKFPRGPLNDTSISTPESNNTSILTPESNDTSMLTPDMKLSYLVFIVIIRVAIPFMLILTGNIILFASLRRSEMRIEGSQRMFLVRHGTHLQVTPMIFFSSCFLLLTISPRYLVQFYVNYFRQSFSCSLIHFVPHLLKTLELFNYSFNVFISIVSGKYGRHELFNMLLCRTKNFNSKLISPPVPLSITFTRTSYNQRSNQKLSDPTNTTDRPLLSNNYS